MLVLEHAYNYANCIECMHFGLLNRHNFLQPAGDVKTPLVKVHGSRLSGKVRKKDEAKLESKYANMESSTAKEKVSGVLLETFADVLALVSHDSCELLSSGSEEELNFGADAADNSLFLIRLDVSSSYTLPAIMFFVEWLAFCPDVAAAGCDFPPTILDFSGKRSFVSNGNKEKKACVKRILAAGKTLTNAIRVDQKAVYFDSKAKKFLIGVVPSREVTFSSSAPTATNSVEHETPTEKTIYVGNVQPITQPKVAGEEDDDDEVIVFQPAESENRTEMIGSNRPPSESLKLSQSSTAGDLKLYSSTMSAPLDSLHQHNTFGASPIPVSAGSILPQYLQPVQMHASRCSVEEAMSLVSSLNGMKMLENGHLTKWDIQENVGLPDSATSSIAIQQPITAGGIFYSRTKVPETVMPSRIDAMVSPRVTSDALATKTTSASQVAMRRSPISRPVRHLGRPPGFIPVPLKPPSESVTAAIMENPLMDNYRWLDGYQLSPLKSSGIVLWIET
ncbi:Detected protein of confused Function [Hibiscus syriacus]|uniref:Detected protein of confused Function n=1 Tax=Hibiscus syriacus TaxID=106335 RepID=A0A6A3B2S5_HIBSY|nr:Detected protein of confused Function [Hibiscus syriacus]